MFYALVHYLAIDTKVINEFRKKYDPQFDLIAPHITLVFPVSKSIGEQYLVFHIETILGKWKPFPIHLQGLYKSLDNYLFLILQQGNAEIICLHNQLYTGILNQYSRVDKPFIPHITLGKFDNSLGQYSQALTEAQQLKFNYFCIMNKLHLVKINDDKSRIILSKEFSI